LPVRAASQVFSAVVEAMVGTSDVRDSWTMPEEDAQEGPITVPYQEPSEEEQEWLRHQAALSDYIANVCGNLKTEVAYVEHTASLTDASSSRDAMTALAAQCSDLSAKGYAAANQLTSAGIDSSVYSVRACHEVGFRANSAAGHASNAASSEYESDIKINLEQVVNDLSYASGSINGA
jgi:hypothetical protein